MWLSSGASRPYNSFGNGAAMRVSAAGFLAESLEEARALARSSAGVTHNHPEGIKGAVATAEGIFLARGGASLAEIRSALSAYYDLDFTLDAIRPDYDFDVTCQGTVPQAVVAFLESEGFEDAKNIPHSRPCRRARKLSLQVKNLKRAKSILSESALTARLRAKRFWGYGRNQKN